MQSPEPTARVLQPTPGHRPVPHLLPSGTPSPGSGPGSRLRGECGTGGGCPVSETRTRSHGRHGAEFAPPLVPRAVQWVHPTRPGRTFDLRTGPRGPQEPHLGGSPDTGEDIVLPPRVTGDLFRSSHPDLSLPGEKTSPSPDDPLPPPPDRRGRGVWE